MPKICPKCNSQTNDTANFCQQCGQHLIGQPLDPTRQPANPVWIAAILENIKDARISEMVGAVLFVIGFGIIIVWFVITTIFPAIGRDYNILSWSIFIGSMILVLVGTITHITSGEQKNKLIEQLKKGK